eukprot:3565677-Pleurochrysis_carterae.AAC.3
MHRRRISVWHVALPNTYPGLPTHEAIAKLLQNNASTLKKACRVTRTCYKKDACSARCGTM